MEVSSLGNKFGVSGVVSYFSHRSLTHLIEGATRPLLRALSISYLLLVISVLLMISVMLVILVLLAGIAIVYTIVYGVVFLVRVLSMLLITLSVSGVASTCF